MQAEVSFVKSLFDKGKLFLKSVIIFVMAIVLWIPTNLITDLVKERESRQKEAIADINSKWAGKQTVMPPILAIPYLDTSKKRNVAYFMADKVDVRARVIPEIRYRGIYQVVVYRSEISIKENFNPIQWRQFKIMPEFILWNEAALLFKVSDNQRGINEDITGYWNEKDISFSPQASGFSHLPDAFAAPVQMNADEASVNQYFQMKFSLNGSEQLMFATTAKENRLQLESDWHSPSFTGVKLPDTRTVKDSGFVANWKYMNRTLPQVWENTVYPLEQNSYGADLVITVDSYDKTLRSVKYSLLCIILTFAAFFLVETSYKRPLHLVQYGLAGLALVLFYSLLLSISEYTQFGAAYLIAGAATVGLIGWFVGSVLKSSKLAIFISMVLTVVYAYIFSIIQLEDYALLMGSVGLFLALAIIMYFSRKLKWS